MIRLEIAKSKAKSYEELCSFAEAYIDEHHIRRTGVKHAIKNIRDGVKSQA